MKSKRRAINSASNKIGVIFLILGTSLLILIIIGESQVLAPLLILTVIGESQVLAFIGLSLTFWGALFLTIAPRRYVEGTLLDSAALSAYLTIDRIIKDLKYNAKAYHIPPYPKDVYLPEHLKGLKDVVVFISADNGGGMPSVQELAEGKFLLENHKGVLMTPPGVGLVAQIEKTFTVDLTKTQLSEMCEILPHFILENFSLAKEMEMALGENQVTLKIDDSIYKNLYSAENNLKSISILGCPIVSAVACVIAKTSGKPVMIQRQSVSPDGLAIEVSYQIVQG